jgi:hypothetical protein
MPIDRSMPTPTSHRGELSTGGRDLHASAYANPASLVNADPKALKKERKQLVDEYDRSLLTEAGHIHSAQLEKLTHAQHKELLRRFPLTMAASIAQWQDDTFTS